MKGGDNVNDIILEKPVESDGLFDKIEDYFNIKIPNDVKKFLKVNSQGIVKEEEFKINGKTYMLAYFCTFDEKDNNNMIFYARDINSNNYLEKDTFIPFAGDGFGNYYGLLYHEGVYEKIVFFNHETNEFSFVCYHFWELIEALNLWYPL